MRWARWVLGIASIAATWFWAIVALITIPFVVSYYRGECDGGCRHGGGAELIARSATALVGMLLAIALGLTATRTRSGEVSDRRLVALLIAELLAAGVWLALVFA
jgi:hypothetical protein